ncbi:hypothetical protein TraAM80_01937 [Trypanosoma rangeli]|uniref:Uncharacterized protein n=1 Tax=Trypanosoma rangeli TaxID=5698 RepID=A0A3R7NYK9_TRYRA|nr:uncharacterized protein TraAM80_01937 [Trypanosoma rangeli]RNF09803.1 hypothetical protein TraAM80_01937 [Trypanosoma rangeli]|eukprot:RNF09803.1 hypothetical protein TraAM80_01937 [Trypanosoma rangeli]
MGATCAKNGVSGGISKGSYGRKHSGSGSHVAWRHEPRIHVESSCNADVLPRLEARPDLSEYSSMEVDDVLSIPSVARNGSPVAQTPEQSMPTLSGAFRPQSQSTMTGLEVAAKAAAYEAGAAAVLDEEGRLEEPPCDFASTYEVQPSETNSAAACVNGTLDGPPLPFSPVYETEVSSSASLATNTVADECGEGPVAPPSAAGKFQLGDSDYSTSTSNCFTCVSFDEGRLLWAQPRLLHSATLDPLRGATGLSHAQTRAVGSAEAGAQKEQACAGSTSPPKNLASEPSASDTARIKTKEPNREEERHNQIICTQETLVEAEVSGGSLIEKTEDDVQEVILAACVERQMSSRQPGPRETHVDPVRSASTSASQRMSPTRDISLTFTPLLVAVNSVGARTPTHTEPSLLLCASDCSTEVANTSSTVNFAPLSQVRLTEETLQDAESQQPSLQLPLWGECGSVSSPAHPHNTPPMVSATIANKATDVSAVPSIREQVGVERCWGSGSDCLTNVEGSGVKRLPLVVAVLEGHFATSEITSSHGNASHRPGLSTARSCEGLVVTPRALPTSASDLHFAHCQCWGALPHTTSSPGTYSSSLSLLGTAPRSTVPRHRGGLLSPFPLFPPSHLTFSGTKEVAVIDSFETGCHVHRRSCASPSPEQPHLSSSLSGHLCSPGTEFALSKAVTRANSSEGLVETVADSCAVGERKSSRYFCRWCDEPYAWREVCVVADELHDVLRIRRKHEKEVKKRAQWLLRCGRIQEAVSELQAAGVV